MYCDKLTNRHFLRCLGRRRKMSTSFWGEVKKKRAGLQRKALRISSLLNASKLFHRQRPLFSTGSRCQVSADSPCTLRTRLPIKHQRPPLPSPTKQPVLLIDRLHAPMPAAWWGSGCANICRFRSKAKKVARKLMTAMLLWGAVVRKNQQAEARFDREKKMPVTAPQAPTRLNRNTRLNSRFAETSSMASGSQEVQSPRTRSTARALDLFAV